MNLVCRLRRWNVQARAWVLAAFALSVLTASAAPLVHPRALQLVCSAESGPIWVALDPSSGLEAGPQTDAAAAGALDHLLDCALCLPVMGPALGTRPVAARSDPAPAPGALARQPARAEPAPGLQPPRGPPAQA